MLSNPFWPPEEVRSIVTSWTFGREGFRSPVGQLPPSKKDHDAVTYSLITFPTVELPYHDVAKSRRRRFSRASVLYATKSRFLSYLLASYFGKIIYLLFVAIITWQLCVFPMFHSWLLLYDLNMAMERVRQGRGELENGCALRRTRMSAMTY